MSSARYPLRSLTRNVRRSSLASEDTINNPMATADPAASQVLDGTVDENLEPIPEVIAGPSSPIVVAQVDTSEVSGDKIHHPRLLGKLIHTEVLQDTIQAFRTKCATPPPMIPLCRLVVNEAIRTVSEHISDLGYRFRTSGYLPEQGKFMVSVPRDWESEHEVTSFDEAAWGPIWCRVNREFEDELLNLPEWKHLSNKKFIVWDGNHRCKSWMARVKEGTCRWCQVSVWSQTIFL